MIKLFKLLLKWQWKEVFAVILFSIININAQLNIIQFFPLIVTYIKDNDLDGIMIFLPSTLSNIFVSVFCSLILVYLITRVTSSFSYKLKEKLFNILLNLKTIGEFNKINYSGVMTRLIRGVDTEQSFLILIFKRILPIIISTVFIIIALLAVDDVYAMLFAVAMLILGFIFIFRLNQLANQYFKVKKIYGKLNNLFLGKISTLKTIKLFSKEKYSSSLFKEESDDAYNKGFRFQYKLNFSVIWLIVVHLCIIYFMALGFAFFDDDKTGAIEIFVSLLFMVYANERYEAAKKK